jgi:hypothetical protein
MLPLIAGGLSLLGGLFSKNPKPQQTQVVSPVSQAQANQAFDNTQSALQQQQAFTQALQGQNGIQNQSDVYNMLAMQAAGQGPNPAAAALQQATGQNVAAQNALMAGQRGASANPALMARQAAMQGANLQQQAAGQGALMQAQQQAQAMQGMGNIAGQQVGNLAGAQQMYGNTALNQQQNLLNSIANANSANVQNTANFNTANQNNAQTHNKILGGFTQAAGAIPGLFKSDGGEIPSGGNTGATGVNRYNQGGQVESSGPQSAIGKAMMGMQEGGVVPGKAEVSGDSLKNDTVPAILSPGEIVIPRSIAQGPDAAKKAAEFVAAIHSRKKHSSKRK